MNMKRILILANILGVSIILWGCSTNSNVSTDLNNIESIFPKELVPCSNFKITPEMERQIQLIEFIDEMYSISYGLDFLSEQEMLYNSRLFYNGNPQVIYYETFSDDMSDATSFKCMYNNQGDLQKLINLNDPDRKYEITYNRNGLLASIIFYSKSIASNAISQNEVRYNPSKKIFKKTTFFYKNGILNEKRISYDKETISAFKNEIPSIEKNTNDGKGLGTMYFYYKNLIDSTESFISEVTGLGQKVTCFKNNKIRNIIYMDINKKPTHIETFIQNGNGLKISYYEFKDEPNPHYPFIETIDIEIGNDLKVNKIIRNNGRWLDEKYYRYFYNDNVFMGYAIYEGELPIKKNDDNNNINLEFYKAFLKNSR